MTEMLPSEMLWGIFRYIRTVELCEYRIICERWKDVISDMLPARWYRLVVRHLRHVLTLNKVGLVDRRTSHTCTSDLGCAMVLSKFPSGVWYGNVTPTAACVRAGAYIPDKTTLRRFARKKCPTCWRYYYTFELVPRQG